MKYISKHLIRKKILNNLILDFKELLIDLTDVGFDLDLHNSNTLNKFKISIEKDNRKFNSTLLIDPLKRVDSYSKANNLYYTIFIVYYSEFSNRNPNYFHDKYSSYVKSSVAISHLEKYPIDVERCEINISFDF